MRNKKIFSTITQINPKLQNTIFSAKWDSKPVYKGTLRDLQKYQFLYQLEIKDIKKFGYLKKFQELQRKFHWYKLKKPHKAEGGFVGTPLNNNVYNKMSVNNWLQSMKVFDGANSRKNLDNILKGGKTEHHRQFEKEVSENPDRFFDLLLKLKDKNIHPDYMSAGINGLMSIEYDGKNIRISSLLF